MRAAAGAIEVVRVTVLHVPPRPRLRGTVVPGVWGGGGEMRKVGMRGAIGKIEGCEGCEALLLLL